MVEIFQYWQVNLVLAITLFVVMHQHYRILGQEVKDTSSLPMITGIIGSIIFVLLMPFFDFKLPNNWQVYALFFAANLIYVIHDILKAKGYKYLDVSVSTILFQLSKVFFIFYGLVFFHEKLSILEIIGIVLVLGGVTLVSLNKEKFSINKYAWIMFGAALAFATAMSIDVGISKQFSLPFYLLVIYTVPATIIFFAGRKGATSLKKDFFISKKSPRLFIIAGTASALGMLFYLLALRQGQISIVAPLSSVTVLLNIIVSYIFLKERQDTVKRVVAAILVITGIFLLV